MYAIKGLRGEVITVITDQAKSITEIANELNEPRRRVASVIYQIKKAGLVLVSGERDEEGKERYIKNDDPNIVAVRGTSKPAGKKNPIDKFGKAYAELLVYVHELEARNKELEEQIKLLEPIARAVRAVEMRKHGEADGNQ